jgi:hypothetical protein
VVFTAALAVNHSLRGASRPDRPRSAAGPG